MTAGRTNSSSLSIHWGTPRKIIDAVQSTFGGSIALDPCSNEWSVVGAETAWSLPEYDGLAMDWRFDTIYVNPPYGSDFERKTRIGDWLAKCADAAETYGSEVIALVPVAGNTRHWKNWVWPKAKSICFLYDPRVRFLENGRDTGKGAPMACASIYWGDRSDQFANAFAHLGAVVDLSNVKLPEPEGREELVNPQDLSVRETAKRAGISPATVSRFKNGKSVDIATMRKLVDAGFVKECPCCGFTA